MTTDKRLQCHWMHPTIARLYIERAAYERAERLRDIAAAQAEITLRLWWLR